MLANQQLPHELLYHILGYLSPAVLVNCRAVCRGWREAVDQMRADDRRFAYVCGYNDLLLSGRVADAAGIAPADLAAELSYAHDLACDGNDYDVVVMPCTCGLYRKFAFVPDATDVAATATRLNYGARHGGALQPSRWRSLQEDRALAQTITDACGRLDGRFFVAGFGYNSEQPPWYPYVLRLPSVPANIPQLEDANALARVLEQAVEVGGSSFGIRVEPFEDALAQWTERIDERVVAWQAARAANMSVSVFLEEAFMSYMYGDVLPWSNYDTDEMTSALAQQQHALVALAATLNRLTHCAIVFSGGCGAENRVVAGLSPNGNLVGAMTFHDSR